MLMLGSIGVTVLASLFVLVCLLMMAVILIQKPRGGGLSGAFSLAGKVPFSVANLPDRAYVDVLAVACEAS